MLWLLARSGLIVSWSHQTEEPSTKHVGIEVPASDDSDSGR